MPCTHRPFVWRGSLPRPDFSLARLGAMCNVGIKPKSKKNPFHGSCINIKLNFWDRQLNMRVSEVISASKFSIGYKVDSEVCYAVACFRAKDTFHLSWIWSKRVANNRSTYEYTRSKESLFVLKAFDINLPLRSHMDGTAHITLLVR